MTWPFDDGSAFPVFDGLDVGGQQARTMAERAGGYSGIRTVIEQNPDGSITTLRTRYGNPIYETTYPTSASTQADLYRGFVAKASSRAVLFDPYTLEILNANYTPALNTYTVLDFATSWNVAPDDTTNWFDVALFDGTTIKINGKAMPTLGITANHGFQAIPYVINRETAEDQYGNAERNTTEKRVFAVGRDRVRSWGGGGVTETLTPSDARTEDRAMTVGQRVDFSTDTAWLGQLFYPPGYSWDGAGEWYYTSAQILMTLTSTYLLKTAGNSNVAMSPPSFGGPTASSGSHSNNVTLPPTPVGMTGLPYVSQDFTYDGTSGGDIVIRWGFSDQIVKPLLGQLAGSYTRTSYSGTSVSSETQSGRTLEYAASNVKDWDVRGETYSILAQYIAWASHVSSPTYTNLNATSTTLFWGLEDNGYSVADVVPTRGTTGRYISGGMTPYPNTSQNRSYETQAGSASVSIGANNLVELSYYRQKSYGEKIILTGNTSYYPPYFGPDKYSFYGMGYLNRSEISYVYNPGSDTIPMIDFYKQNPSPPPNQLPDAIAEVNAMYSTMRDALMGQVVYDSEDSSGYDYRTYGGDSFYFSSISPNVDLDNSTMSCSTKDYILYDETNGVYISVESSFVGIDTTATLTVSLKVQTRHHTTTQTLGEYNYTYSQLVQEREIGATGKYAMPSPQIRAIFAPLHQEQGSFKGAAYTPLAEENNGATPAHLFNFVLHLEPYSSIGTINDDNATNATVHFVPCNLLEMLYAFVFSQEYGVAEDGQRYPVTFTTRYNDMMNTLFSNPVRVSVRDGVQGSWSDVFGPDFASISTVSLHRV